MKIQQNVWYCHFKKYSKQYLLLLFSLLVFCYWQFGFPYTLFFQEPLQLFLCTSNYLIRSISTAGGLSGYLGEFFTQFYVLPLGGPLVLLLWLIALQQLTWLLFQKASFKDNHFYLLSFLPSLWYGVILSEEFYLLSGLISVVIAMVGVLFYVSIKNFKVRSLVGILLIPLIYFVAGGSYILFTLSIFVYELVVFRKKDIAIRGIYWVSLFFDFLIAIFLPLFYRMYFDPVPLLQAYITEHFHKIFTVFPFPVVVVWLFIPLLIILVFWIGVREIKKTKRIILYAIQVLLLFLVGYRGYTLFANPKAEYIKKFDYNVRHKNWLEVISLAEKQLPYNAFAVNYLNLALAKTNQLGDRLFHFEQMGTVGLFLPYEREMLSAMLGNETYYQIGLVNVSQQYIFEANEAMPDLRKSTRCLKRLTDVAIINGYYELANKYIQLLKKTLFYKNWAKEAETYLYDEDKINNHPDWGEKRRLRPLHDYFFSVENIDQILLALLNDHPQHKMAYEYLMSYYLLNKDIRSFMKYVSLGYNLHYEYLPLAFQEAVLYALSLDSREAIEKTTFPIEKTTKDRLYRYIAIYTQYPNARELLKRDFSHTFWYYYHYK